MSAKITLIFVAALAVIATAGLAVRAYAEPTQETVAVRVSVADLNLDSEAGVKTMLSRVRWAASGIIRGDPPPVIELYRRDLYRACVAQATDRAVASLDSPFVTAVYARHAQHPSLVAAR